MLTAHAITRRADRDGVSSAVVERDYVLAHIVAQLHLVALEKTKCPRQESNLRTWLRRPMLYPLSYEGIQGIFACSAHFIEHHKTLR
jgi:hypothetical protein